MAQSINARRKSVSRNWSLAGKAFEGLLTLAPTWVSNVFDLLGRSIDREYNLRRGENFSPRVLGVLAGQIKSSCQLFARKGPNERTASPHAKKVLRLIRLGFREFQPLLENVYDLLNKTSEKLPLAELTKFTQGKSMALGKNAKDPVFFRTDATELYGLLICLAPVMPRIKSVRQLHEVLVQMIGGKAGDLKRVEGICRKIKLKFGPPGRPRRMIR